MWVMYGLEMIRMVIVEYYIYTYIYMNYKPLSKWDAHPSWMALFVASDIR